MTDEMVIYQVDNNGVAYLIRTCYGSTSGTVSTTLPTGRARVVLRTVYGAQCGTDGLTFSYRIQANCDYDTLRVCNSIGIGVSAPTEALHINGKIKGNGLNNAITIAGVNSSSSVSIGASTTSAQYSTTTQDHLFMQPIRLTNGQLGSAASANLSFRTGDNVRMTILRSNGNVGIGTTSPSATLDVNGTIAASAISTEHFSSEFLEGSTLYIEGRITANEIFVENTSGADFVFDENYRLRNLQEVKEYIQENQHLPEIQSAAEMQENGVNMSDFQIQLLQKIEELTLYIINQEDRIKELEGKLTK